MIQPILAVMYREFKIRSTSLTWLFYDLLMPFAYLLLFGVGFDIALQGGISTGGARISYNNFFVPGVLSMACFGIAINTSYGFFVDRDNGIFYEFLTYPMTRGQFLIGKITFNCLTAIVQAVMTIVLANILLHVSIPPAGCFMLMAGVIVGTAGWFFFLTIFALRIRRNDMFNTFINVIYFLVLFLSSIFYPIERMPAWFALGSYCNPITWHVDALRFFSTGLGAPAVVFLEMAAFGLFLTISFWAAVRSLQRSR